MKPSASLYYEVRGLRYHVRHWPGTTGRRVVLLHGWMDVSASFQFLVDALPMHWEVFAPDWRGYGLSDWGKSDCYWFPDYLADLDSLLERISPQAPVDLVGHSLGGNVACLYAGVRPARIRRLVNLEGFGMSVTRPEQAPGRYARWLDELGSRSGFRPYAGFGALAARLQQNNPRLTGARAEFLARHWGREMPDGQVQLRGDPAHKIVYPVLYRYEEARACWREVAAPVLWVDAAESKALERVGLDATQHAERRASFRNLRYVTLSAAGHMLHHDQPEQVARLLEDFLSAP
jgi:pimeloyl-ACP methyl ester carboxylesterase